NRGYAHAAAGRWREAAPEFRQASELQPDEIRLWLFRAVAHAAAGDRADYRQTCVALVNRFEKTDDLRQACCVIRACVLTAEALGDTGVPPERLSAFARV